MDVFIRNIYQTAIPAKTLSPQYYKPEVPHKVLHRVGAAQSATSAPCGRWISLAGRIVQKKKRGKIPTVIGAEE